MGDKSGLVLIVGGGPAGLAAALAFNNNKYTNIVVLEGRDDMSFDPENSYPVGLNVRGQTAIKHLFGASNPHSDVSGLGLRVDRWRIFAGPGINVANFDSGLVVGTSRADVTHLLFDETQRRSGEIRVMFGCKATFVDLKARLLKGVCSSSGEEKEFRPACVVIADGYKSRIRDMIAKQDTSLSVQVWPWNASFRVLTSDANPQTELDPYVHYIRNQIYISQFLNGKWTAGINIQPDSPEFLSSNEPTESNIAQLEDYLKQKAPEAHKLFTKEEFGRYFSRNIFTGSVTKASRLQSDKWAVLIGDAAHSAFPATGEGINSALEDGHVLQKSLESAETLEDGLVEFDKVRLEDANALSDMAYGTINQNFKSSVQMIFLSLFKSVVGPTKEDLLFGKQSATISRYSEAVELWKKQTRYLGGPNIPE